MKWMTPQNTPQSKPEAFDYAIFIDSFFGIFRTGWKKTAAMSEEWADRCLVETKNKNYKPFHEINIHEITSFCPVS